MPCRRDIPPRPLRPFGGAYPLADAIALELGESGHDGQEQPGDAVARDVVGAAVQIEQVERYAARLQRLDHGKAVGGGAEHAVPTPADGWIMAATACFLLARWRVRAGRRDAYPPGSDTRPINRGTCCAPLTSDQINDDPRNPELRDREEQPPPPCAAFGAPLWGARLWRR